MSDFEEQVKAWRKWLEDGEPGDCPYCGAEPGKAHKRKLCYGSSPETDRNHPLTEALEEMPEAEAKEFMDKDSLSALPRRELNA